MNMQIVGNADVVGPEVMPRKRTQCCKRLSNGTWRAWRVGVLRVTDDAQKTVLRDRACSETSLANAGEPFVCQIVLHVRRVDERNQNIDVQQECRHGCSSRS